MCIRDRSKPLAASLIHLPFGIGNAIGSLAVSSNLRKLYGQELRGMDDGGRMKAFLCDHATRNVVMDRTLISTLRNCPELDDNRATLEECGRSPRPVLVVWGSADETVTRSNVDKILRLFPRATLEVIEGQRHSPILTAEAETNRVIRCFLAAGQK